MKKLIPSFCALLITGALLSGCQKGDTGATGAQGNANVVSSGFTVAPSAWTQLGTYNSLGYGFQVDIPDADITSDIVNNGAIMVYGVNSDGSLSALPFTIAVAAAGANQAVDRSWAFTVYAGDVYVYYEDSDFETSQPTANYVFKIVVIAGAQLAKHHINKSAVQNLTYSEAVSIATN